MFTVTIETDNDAFTPDPRPELARILRRVADHIEAGLDAGTLADINGNTVGSFSLTES
jgi:hypothetical protein